MNSATHILDNLWLVVDDAGIEHRVATRAGGSAEDAIATWQQALSPPTPLPTANDVRAEAQRRIIRLVGATDITGCLIKQLNASMRATELTNKIATGGTLTTDEAAEAAALKGLADAIKAIRAASNAMEAEPPADYAADGRWV